MMLFSRLVMIAAPAFLLQGASPPDPAPELPPAPQAAPASPPPASPAPPPMPVHPGAPENWEELASTPGDWRYARSSHGSAAQFGTAPDAPLLELRCDLATRRIGVLRTLDSTPAGDVPARILTEFDERLLTAQPVGGRIAAIWFNARDPFLDSMALSKGRFAVEVGGAETLYLPSWAEVTRVIEDCR